MEEKEQKEVEEEEEGALEESEDDKMGCRGKLGTFSPACNCGCPPQGGEQGEV